MDQVNFVRKGITNVLLPLSIITGVTLTLNHVLAAPAETAHITSPAIALPDFTSLVTQTGPAVVNIRVTQSVHSSSNGLPPGMDKNDPFFEFFRRFQGQGPEGQAAPVQGIGSGFIISPDGYILTNAHVVDDSSDVQVKLTDRREFKAKVIGIDKKSDIAMVKIDAKDLPTLKIGDPESLKVGEWVAAIGSPFGLENTVTAGIVSAKARALPDDTYVPFIQTDVPVNPGNSGGPLLNMRGEVVGINSQIYSRNGGYMGLSFAIPIDVAMKIGDQLQHNGKVEHGRIGVMIQPMTRDLAESFGMTKTEGALVSQVQPDSPAEKAGVQTGDIIIGVDGTTIRDSIDLTRLVADLKPESTATLHVLRKGEEKRLQIIIGRLDGDQLAEADNQGGSNSGRLGVMVRPLDAGERQELKQQTGVMVEQVDGPAAKAGIHPGDVILAVNSRRVMDAAELKNAIENAGTHVALLIKREDAEIFVPVNLS